jgi:3-dehydroquinate synthase
MKVQTVNVKIASKSYDVLFGRNLIDEAGIYAASVLPVNIAAVITDSVVDGLYSERLIASLKRAGFGTVKYVFPAGETSKNAYNYIQILEFMAEQGLTRTDAVFALGGGVAGDMAGFAAATYLRGIGFVQVPTTLLAMVDSSVGGKTGIDLRAGKNLAGAFYQPDRVLIDFSVLETLPDEKLSDGWAEIIKYGMICDRELLEKLIYKDGAGLEDIIVRCVEIKRDIVGGDEKESGIRKLLNFGHTVGHAIEKCSDYTVSHGRAVAIGMAVITRAGVRAGLCGNDCLDVLTELLTKYRLPDKTDINEAELFEAMLSDKKRNAEGITLIVPETVGSCVLKNVSLDYARELLHSGM